MNQGTVNAAAHRYGVRPETVHTLYSGTDVGKQEFAFFRAHGYSPAAAAGIVGNTKQESSNNPNAPGGGLIQGQGGRTSSGTAHQQFEGVLRELEGPERSTAAALKAAKSPEQAARIFSERFERPGIPMLGNRERYAREAFKQGGSAAPSAPLSLPGMPTTSSAAATTGGLDKAAFQKAQTDSEIGKLFAANKEGGSELFSSGLLSTREPNPAEYQTVKPVPPGEVVAEHQGNPIVKVSEGPKAGQTVYVPTNMPNAKGGIGFTAAPGTTYNKGVLPEIASRANKVAQALGLKLTGLSGGRTPQHSVAVGGFADDPHTKNEASDTPGIERVPKAVLNKYGLERPFPGSKEADHIQLLHSVNKNGGY